MVLFLLGGPLLDEWTVLGAPQTDIQQQFYASRAFGFRELAAGRIAQWNPHTYCGAPYLGSMQSALLYPPNLIFLVLPTSLGINWSIGLHLCLLAGLTYAWARSRQIGREGSFLAGTIAVLGGASFLHVYAGHLSNICTMAWTPLVLMAIEHVARSAPRGERQRAIAWGCAGAVAVAMQIYAGHPQYLFYTGVTAVLYSALLLGTAWWVATPRPGLGTLAATGFSLCAIYPLGAALGAAQLLPGIAASRETIRSAPVPFSFAAMFGFPQENLLTLVAPFFFGGMQDVPYWGRCYLWEMCLYVGVVGLVLAVFAAWPHRGLRAWVRHPDVFVPVCMIGILLVLALGNNTPLFSALYYGVPGFGKFRGISKFTFPASLFIALLAGMGFDQLHKTGRAPVALVRGTFVMATVGLVGGFLLQFVDLAPWIRSMIASQECYLIPAAAENVEFQRQVRIVAVQSLLAVGITAAGLGLLLTLLAKHPVAIHLVLVLGIGELCLFASRMAATAPVGSVPRPEITRFIAEHPGDYRVLDLINPDAAMAGGYDNIWGYTPDLTRRYGEFMAFTQDMNPDEATPYVNFKRIDPLYRMLRLKYAFVPRENGIEVVECPDPLPRAFLVHKYRVIKDRDAMFAAMREPAFDPSQEVLLEEEPQLEAALTAAPTGAVTVVDKTSDSLCIDVSCESPAILVVSDVYANDWRVRIVGSERKLSALLPANHIMRAVVVPAGSHRLEFRYRPIEFVAGGLSLVLVAPVLAWFALKTLGCSVWARPRGRLGV